MPRPPRAGAHFPSTRPLRSSAHLHLRIVFVRFVATMVTVTGATGITRLMWGLPSQVDALLAVTIAAGWCLWLERHKDYEPW
jgi:uncharacterized membrane protein YkvI